LLGNSQGHSLGHSLDTLLEKLLQQPLTTESAIQIALINNPQIRVEYARLGIAAAAVYDAGRLSNPGLGASVMSSSESSAANQVTFGLAQSFTDLLLLSSRSRLADAQFERSKQEAGAAIINLAADVGVAWFDLVGAQQTLAMRTAVASAAQVAASLAQRFFDAGNVSALELALAQSAASEAQIGTLRAKAEVVTARSALNQLLGFHAGDSRWTLPDQLRLPVGQEDELADLLLLAQQSRLDLAAKRTQLELLADSLGISRSFRYVGAIEVGVETERETDRSRITGPNLSVELPIFNTGEGKLAQAEAELDQAHAQWQLLALQISNDVQLAHAKVLSSRSLLQLYQQSLLPQQQAIVRYTQHEFNYMLTGQFELLAAKQQEYAAYNNYLEALRDYWIARTELERAVGAQLPSAADGSTVTVGPIQLNATVPAESSHSDHNAHVHQSNSNDTQSNDTHSHSTQGGHQ
jgi:cobalt-zinc-cadmium efflux system outer membrane protein